MTDEQNKPKSPIILPSSETEDVISSDSVDGKLKLSDVELGQLGIKSKAELGDDIVLERSPIDGACIVSVSIEGTSSCWYCFLPFAPGIPELNPIEIQPAMKSGSHQGLRIKVHAKCHLQYLEKRRGLRMS